MAAQETASSARADTRAVVEIDHVTKRFDDYVAVLDADFTIGAGEFFSMLGPSGCGKTTTLRMIAGFETPTSGAIRLEGVDVSRVPPHKRNVNTVFQHYALFPHMTVWDNVAYGPRSQRKDKSAIKKSVDEGPAATPRSTYSKASSDAARAMADSRAGGKGSARSMLRQQVAKMDYSGLDGDH